MKEKIALLSVFVNLILAVGKIIIGFIAKSTSVLAEGVHSSMDVISSGISLIGIKISKKPVDEKHPYGHHKFEVLSGLIITIILFLTGIWILYKAYQGFLKPEKISLNYLAVIIMIFSIILNQIMARLKIRYGKKENSLSLISDGVHDKADAYTSIAVLIGLFIMPYWQYIDAILALLIGLYIVKESLSLGKEATDSLLDVSAGEEIENKIKKIIQQKKIETSEIKTQKKGSIITANIEIKLPKELNIEKATQISNNLKQKLIKEIDCLEYIAIQIQSHDFTTSYFQPKDTLSKLTGKKGFGWKRRGKFQQENNTAKAMGPGGYCICPKCNYKQKHNPRKPCFKIKCPKCKTTLTRG